MFTKGFLATLVVAVILAGCDSVDDDVHAPVYLVESYQIANQPLRPVRLSRTASIYERYDTTALAVQDAEVRIHRLSAAREIDRTYLLVHDPESPGFYFPESTELVVALRTYRLEIRVGGDEVTSETTVPGSFDLVSVNRREAVYQSDEQLEFVFTPSQYPGRQTVYIFTSETLVPRADQLTPFWERLYEDGDVALEDLRIFTSPPLNEANYDVNPATGTITTPMPWLMVAFYGRQRVTANAIDDNMLDFVRSHQVQQGGSTLSPGEIPNVLDHVDGGTGIFGSYASVATEVTILR